MELKAVIRKVISFFFGVVTEDNGQRVTRRKKVRTITEFL